MPELDLLTVGRVNLDLYAREPGVEFAEVAEWTAMPGGSPTNAALAAARLGVRAGVLTAVGEDLVGDWVLAALRRAGVETEYVLRKAGPHTSLALRAQVPPDHPLAFYRHDPADIQVTIADASRAPVERASAVLVSADGLARGPMAAACLSVLRRAQRAQRRVYMDLDLRHVNWPGLGAFADMVALAVEDVDVLLGTEAEFCALLGDAAPGDEESAAAEVCARLCQDAGLVAVLKKGERGATIFAAGELIEVPAFPITEASTVGAGDSFAGGLIAARLDGRDWEETGRFAAACAAITAGRPGCSDGFPRRTEVDELLAGASVGGPR